MGAEGAQASLAQIKEMMAEMLAKMKASLKTETAAVRTDIARVLGRIEEIEEDWTNMNKDWWK